MRDVTLLSYGMGVESSAVLARWCFDATARPCPLNELIVITAQTGDEYADTGRDVEAHILPLMRSHSIRFVQVARAGHREADGIVVLDDSTSPMKVHLAGAYKLSDELRRNGTVPQYAGLTQVQGLGDRNLARGKRTNRPSEARLRVQHRRDLSCAAV